MLALPIFVCANIFQAKVLAENKFNNALFDVTDKAVLNTGGNTGIWACIVMALFDAGAIVMLVKWQRDSLKAVLAQCQSEVLAIDLC